MTKRFFSHAGEQETKTPSRTAAFRRMAGPACCAGALSLAAILPFAATFSGCGSTTASSAYTEQVQPIRRLQDSAPTAREMEAALHSADQTAPPPVGNGAGHNNFASATPAASEDRVLPPVIRNPAPHIDEMMTVPTRDIRGDAFPGVTTPFEPVVIAKPSEEALKTRVRELEERLAEMENRPPRVIETTPEGLEQQLARLQSEIAQLDGATNGGADLSAIESRLDDFQSELAALRREMAHGGESDDGAERFAALEREIAYLQARESNGAVSDALPSEVSERLSRMETELHAMQRERHDGGLDEVHDRFASLEARLHEMQETLSAPASAAPATGLVGDTAVSGALPRHTFSPPTPTSFDDYRIGSGDLLEFQSFNDETLDREVNVRYDGYISLPLIPDIFVADRTREEAEAAIREAYTRIFRNPQISLLVRETSSKTFTIIGDIEQPGVYPYMGSTRLIDAVSAAGGLRRRNANSSVGGFVGITGQLTQALVVRQRDGERVVVQYDMRGLGEPGAHSADAPIFYGDLIYIPEGVNLVYLLGESRNPVIVELTEGMTLLQMLALSGGFNASTARIRDVVLIREVDTEQSRVMHVNVRRMLRTGVDMPLNAGDIVYLPQKRLVRIEEFVRRATGTILPVLELYTSAVEAYYAKDIAEALLQQPTTNRTLDGLQRIEGFGTSTQNIVNLFGRP